MASSTVGEALLHAGLDPAELVGRPGPAFTVELNGRCITLPGTLGEPAVIQKNGEPCELSAPLADGDQLVVRAGRPGSEPRITLGELIDEKAHSFSLSLNGKQLEVKAAALVNGESEHFDYILKDRDKVILKPVTDFRDLFKELGVPLEQEIPFYLNGEARIAVEKLELLINGSRESLRTPLRSGLEVRYFRKPCLLRDQIPAPKEGAPQITVSVNGQSIQLTRKEPVPLVNGQEVSLDYELKPYDRIEYSPGADNILEAYIVTDIFRDFEPDEVFSKKGGTILVNGETAGFTTPIKHGDTIELIPYGAEIANSGMPEE
jgi:molybdopterin converting factor small subunit